MADAITSFIVGKIGSYLIKEASMVMGFKDDLEDLKTELTCIQGYLKDVEAREREDEVSKEWTKLVLDIAYDIEDVLDTYILKAEQRLQRRGLMRLINKVGEIKDVYNIVDDIRTLKRKILDITRKRGTYGIGSSNESRGGGSTSTSRIREHRRAQSDDQEERVIGLADEAKILLEKLLDDRVKNRVIISIFGMGGLGKTAIARKLYNSGDVKRRFTYRAWTYVSQEYKTRDILMRIIRSLGVASSKELEKIRMFAEEELEGYLRDLLVGERYLVVVDDIWEREAWESLKRALPINQRGSRVIMTTRIQAVAESADQRIYPHKLRFLTFEESWILFKQKAFRNIEWVDEDLRKIGRKMVRRCSGLPLAIVVLSGLLSWKRPSEWHEVCASLWRRLEDDSIQVSAVYLISYKEMRHELKLCFLYFSIFPEDYEINVEMLIHLLVAEGFIPEGEGMMMEDVARYYIEELIDRSLVEVVSRERGKVMYCRIHDLLRDVAIKKAKELNFVNVYNERSSSSTCRREVVHHLMNNKYLCDRRENKRMRSFLFFGEQRRMLQSYVETSTLKLKLLRVLNLGGLQFTSKGETSSSLSDVIGDLIHLRYLGISDTGQMDIPAFISNLLSLQTLDATGSNYFEGTTDLSKLTSLRHVIGKFVGELLIGDAVNLQTLRSISSYSWSKLKHELLINLRDVSIYDRSTQIYDRYTQIYEGDRIVTLDLASFSKLNSLRVLILEVKDFKISSSVHPMDVIFPSLESLTLVGTNLEENVIPALQKLPRLEDLALQNCTWPVAKMSIRAQGFGRLRKLNLFMVRLDVLWIEEEAMPNLMKLELKNRGERLTTLWVPERLRALSGRN